MAFTVEDGSGVTGANSYLSLADFQAYCTDRGFDYSAYTTAQQQQALVKATDYIEAHWEWATGTKASGTQGLGWPRSGGIDAEGYTIEDTEVPAAVEAATAELAFKALSTTLGGGDATMGIKRQKVGPIETEFWGEVSETTIYPIVEGLLDGLVSGSGHVELNLL